MTCLFSKHIFFSKMLHLLRHGSTLWVRRDLLAAQEAVCACASVAAAEYKFANEEKLGGDRSTSACSHLPHSANCLVYVVYGHNVQLGYNREHFSSFLLPPSAITQKPLVWNFLTSVFFSPLFHNLNVNMNMRGAPHTVYGSNLTAITRLIFDWI